MTAPAPRLASRFEAQEGSRYASDYGSTTSTAFESGPSSRDRELVLKFQELLGTPFGDAVARIVEETYRLLPPPIAAAQVAVSARGL
jgi:hypothetical protein